MAIEKLALSIQEVCAATGLSRAWIYSEWKAGRGPDRIKAGSRTLIRIDALNKWLSLLSHSPQATE